MTNIDIREATEKDAADIAQIQVEAWQLGYKGIMSDDYLSSLSISTKTEEWVKVLARKSIGIHLVIERENTVVGFCVYGPIRDNDLANSHAGELVALNISPRYWSNGIGTAAIYSIIQASKQRKWDALYLWVLKDNVRAKGIYESIGFVNEGTEKIQTHLTGYELHEIRYVKHLARK